MIRYALRCDREHRFDSWFGSSDDFDRLTDAGLVACAVCGSSAIEKDLMTPGLASSAPASAPDLRAPASPAEQALGELRRRIEAAADDVGRDFAAEAREPGIYIREEGFAVRLENTVLLTDNGPVDLMADIPIEPGEIETLMKRRSRNGHARTAKPGGNGINGHAASPSETRRVPVLAGD